MTETEKAWLAGLFDGEGCVWTRWPKRTNVHAEIKMTHKRTIETVQRLFPGRFCRGSLSAEAFGTRPQWRWSLDTTKTFHFLRLVLPYLVTKADEALIALELCQAETPSERDHWTARLSALRAA